MPKEAKPLILICEDEKEIAEMVADHLEGEDMLPQMFHRGEHAIRFLKSNHANLMLLDVNLPDTTGFQLIEELRQNNIQVPIIFVTAHNSEVSKVKGLDLGADDYLTKPFSLPELTARIKAVLRRTETAKDQLITNNVEITEKPFDFCDAKVNPTRMEIEFPDGASEKIGRKELGIISYLVSYPNTVLTRRSLIHAVWGVHADVRSRSLDQYVVKIRNLLTAHECNTDIFRTVHGVGYIYDPV
ncbi:response regulator transcription factor [Cerasicoccus arenae]|uniref:DNA-binding response regulator n=1 Tax=Cerasicoccus arenae TaxID=424488 RepID=A0A8J3GE47_9BACT|nr:response regulator transcription factor [Cerasicoccus arenae]MBK1859638.1 response regulator transcription factor [Cerasicoccus arenae]GHB96413.1 DNA-binding response regulator [Cerasicoccus arenae]